MLNSGLIGYKVTIIGDYFVGKTSIINRYNDDYFLSPISTINCSYVTAIVKVDGKDVILKLWDTAGQERYKSLISIYLRDSTLVIIVFAMDNLSSFENLSFWIEKVRDECQLDCPIYICGNKIDSDDQKVTQEKAEDLARSKNCEILFTSAKDGTNIKLLFEKIAKELSKTEILFNDQFCEESNKSGCC